MSLPPDSPPPTHSLPSAPPASAPPTHTYTVQGQCYYHLRGWSCAPPSHCGGAHLPKCQRPACERWARTSSTGARCPHGAACFFPHATPASEVCLLPGVECAVLTPASHCGRLCAYLAPLLPPGSSVRACKAHGAFRRSDSLVVLSSPAGQAWPGGTTPALLAALLASPFLSAALIRVFVCSSGAWRSEEEVVAHLASTLPPHCRARLHCHPRSLEARLVAALEAQAAAAAAPPPYFTRQGFTHLLNVVHVQGGYYTGTEGAGSPAAFDIGVLLPEARPAQQPAAPQAVCRAELKLRELVARVPALFALCASSASSDSRVALDVGAAPGGWTRCLLSHPGLALTRVYAVDPGSMDQAALERAGLRCEAWGSSQEGSSSSSSSSSATSSASSSAAGLCTHMRMQGKEAVALLAAAGARLSAFVCDANIPTQQALHCLQAARPLMLPGSAVVITLKNFDGRQWEGRCSAAEQGLRELQCSSVQVLHLFANGIAEVTLLGVCEG